jgi:Calcineurin-like phosphoesterase
VVATVLIIGDVGGCAEQLAAAVDPLLGDPGAVVIQVGDLIDRGPDSSGVLGMVGDRLAGAPRWIQLVGNHELQYLGGGRFWQDPVAAADAELLRSWWLCERVQIAAAVRTADGADLLVTHAGLTFDAWCALGEPVMASTAAQLLNTRPDELLWAQDGPLWAQSRQVYESWLAAPVAAPFGQVHGHSCVVDYQARSWMCASRIRQRCTVDWAARHTVTRISGHQFIGVDPQHGGHGAAQWAPLVLTNAEILA